MIDAKSLLTDLVRQLKRLDADLRERIGENATLRDSLQAEWRAAHDAKRTAETFESWVGEVITQAGVHWLLSCVFLRFIEDNALVDDPWLTSPLASGRQGLARKRHEAYFRAHPTESDNDYLLAAFREAGRLPGLTTFFEPGHNPVFRLVISGDAARSLLAFWQRMDPNTGHLVHDFTDPSWNTRFLGDLYQNLSEAARKRYALLQTPEFVEAFILDRTLTPAIHEFGLREVRLIDPTCGSGHFLLGAFHRLVDEWARQEPARNRGDIAQKALDAVAGVDLNPFAVAIARFRLWVAALRVSEVTRLRDAPNFKLNVAIGDSLLHGARFGLTATDAMFETAEHYAGTGLAHAYAVEDLDAVNRILGRQYHAVVGNPPYITVKDRALNAKYRQHYASCHMKYSLGAPFTERFFELAITGNGRPAGFVGLITTDSFMKREFGAKLIEQVLPRLDLNHVIHTSGAYIPGHGTPTVILFGRHRAPLEQVVRTVMSIKGEPSTPNDPAHGLVWSAILDQIDRSGSESEFVSVSDSPRETFAKHPWSIGGGGAADLKIQIETTGTSLSKLQPSIGFSAITGEDEAFVMDDAALRRLAAPERQLVNGDEVRDWSIAATSKISFYYEDQDLKSVSPPGESAWARHLWRLRTSLRSRLMFGKTPEQAGLHWWELSFLSRDRLNAPFLIAFAEVATHNHFVLDRGGKVFKQTAPVIKLPAGTREDGHLGLLGLLNSSVACFWLKQVCHNKGEGGGTRVEAGNSALGDEAWKSHFAFNSTKVADFPLPTQRPTSLAIKLETLIREVGEHFPESVLEFGTEAEPLACPLRNLLADRHDRVQQLRWQAIAWQEELDWTCYGLYDLLPTDADDLCNKGDAPPPISLGERAFEIVLARRVAAGEETTTWFERHGSTPITEIPSHWPEDYRGLVQRRIDLIESDRNIGLIERPEYKRRWNTPPWDDLEKTALRNWLLDRLEFPPLWSASDDQPPQITTVARLADAVRTDPAFMQVAALYAGHDGFDVGRLVADLVAVEAVPFLPVLRYTETGLRKREQWEATWALQRREDAGENVSRIPVPPKYQNKDFRHADFWRLRGGLDVPKERWVSYPGCERGADPSLPIAWAGWDALQQATALAAWLLEMKDQEGWLPERLKPLLAGLLELVPWLKQWHNAVDARYGERMGDYFAGFVDDQARELGFTLDEVRGWQPAVTVAHRGRGRARRQSRETG